MTSGQSTSPSLEFSAVMPDCRPLAFCMFKKYFVPFSPSWNHLDLSLLHMNSPKSSNSLSLLQIISSIFVVASVRKESDVAVSKAFCQKQVSLLRVFISFSLSFLWLEAISMARDLILIFRNSSFWCGFMLVSLICSILALSSDKNLCFSNTLLINRVSILTILSWAFLALLPSLTMTTQWSDCVYVQSVSTLRMFASSSDDHCILSSLDIFSPCLQVIWLRLSFSQQSIRFRSLKYEFILFAMFISAFDLIVPHLSLSLKVVLKSPLMIVLASGYLCLSLSISVLIDLKKASLSLLWAQGEWILARINSVLFLFSRTSTRAMCMSCPMSIWSLTIMLSLRSVMTPEPAPLLSVKICWPFQMYFNEFFSICVSCRVMIRFGDEFCRVFMRLINCLNFWYFFRPLQFNVANVMFKGPGFSSTSPASRIKSFNQFSIRFTTNIVWKFLKDILILFLRELFNFDRVRIEPFQIINDDRLVLISKCFISILYWVWVISL